MAMRRLTCHFDGRVQGVGFRYTAMNIAQSYDVVGYVRNMPDGRVEMVVEGPEEDRKGLLAEINEHMRDYISDVQTVESSATGEFQRFSVRH